MKEKSQFWQQLREDLEESLGVEKVERWFSSVSFLSDDGVRVTLGVPNLFLQDWIAKRYTQPLVDAISARLGPRRVSLKVDGKLYREFRREESEYLDRNRPDGVGSAALPAPSIPTRVSAASQAEPEPPAAARLSRPAGRPDDSSTVPATPVDCKSPALQGLRSDLTLDRYVVGNCNNVAYNAGMEILRSPGSYNPLFVYGGSGLGKTHLLQGLTREYFRQGLRNIRYLPCETFINHFIRSVKGRSMDRFRKTFHSLQVLVLDDVHILENKEKSQLELLQTIDSIVSRGGQVLLACDSRPYGIQKLQKQLQGRFVSGLVCKIDSPDYPTRLAILRRESGRRGVTMPERVLHHIAERCHKNVRELTGALVQVVGTAKLLGQSIDEAQALRSLEESWSRENRALTMAIVLERVCRAYRLSEEELRGASRARTVSSARQISIYLTRALTQHSLSEIGEFYGHRNHATVNYSIRTVVNSMKRDADFKRTIEKLLSELRG